MKRTYLGVSGVLATILILILLLRSVLLNLDVIHVRHLHW